MASLDFNQSALFEHQFWLQVLGDHARFIYDGLAPKEVKEIERASYFIQTFDTLLLQARGTPTDHDLDVLTASAANETKRIRKFKLHLLRRHLTGEIGLQLPPTFLNHMVNELEEYERILNALQAHQVPPRVHPVHHHLLWLADAVGHSATIANLADPVEKQVISKSDCFTKQFEDYYLKAVEVAGFLRANVTKFPALTRFNHQVELEIRLFSAFLAEIEEMELSDSLLGALSPLLPDHMAREECYFLTKLAEVSEVSPPQCNPTKPRVSAEA